MVPREKKNNAYAKFWGTNKEYYGIFRTGLFKPGFHIIAPVATIAAVVEKRVSATVAIYGNTLFRDSSDKYDSGDERR